MLVEGAAALDIHRLAAHADAKGGEGAGLGEGEDGEVEILAICGGQMGGGVLGLAVEGAGRGRRRRGQGGRRAR